MKYYKHSFCYEEKVIIFFNWPLRFFVNLVCDCRA